MIISIDTKNKKDIVQCFNKGKAEEELAKTIEQYKTYQAKKEMKLNVDDIDVDALLKRARLLEAEINSPCLDKKYVPGKSADLLDEV